MLATPGEAVDSADSTDMEPEAQPKQSRSTVVLHLRKSTSRRPVNALPDTRIVHTESFSSSSSGSSNASPSNINDPANSPHGEFIEVARASPQSQSRVSRRTARFLLPQPLSDAGSADATPESQALSSELIELGLVKPAKKEDDAGTTISDDSQLVNEIFADLDNRVEFPIAPSRLPEAITGRADLKMPPLMRDHHTNVTLASRLGLLGRQSFRLLAALRPMYLGNSVLGYAPQLYPRRENALFILPWLFSKSATRMALFVRFLGLLLFSLLVVDYFGAETLHLGRVWVLGIGLALVVMVLLARNKRAPDGVMAYCRSIGQPKMEGQ